MENPVNLKYDAYIKPMPLFLCPADSNTEGRPTENNYRYNFGGDTPGAGQRRLGGLQTQPFPFEQWFAAGNGAFTIGLKGLESDAYEDGLTHTVFFSERTKGDGGLGSRIPIQTDIVRCQSVISTVGSVEILFESLDGLEVPDTGFTFRAAGRWPEDSDFSNGWPFGMYATTQYNHVAPPNWQGIDCGKNFIPDTPEEHAIVAARSQHPNSVNIAYGDGHVKNIKDNIDLTIWRAIGTRNGGELISSEPRPRRRSLW